MSRSYKKNPYVTDHSSSTKMKKRLANRTVRQRLKNDEDMPARPQHKKMTETWNICDYRWRMTREEAIQWYNEQLEWQKSKGSLTYFLKRYPTLESWLKHWEKCYRRK